ncbi:hypothetical protein [Cryptosporangium aurantiacum]|uniref:Uncharacterized protein n=1 Tax=Cryptosporangium aurantiacum TaxID=134849 RepID=A0A1M7PGF7_9ACTN|nr:hypothetical protein [Cryptosporangium aurantiacum]SHN16084.1 hypothetical protein SAMN05443668_103326 [Cryptosporangium aurantiacum]
MSEPRVGQSLASLVDGTAVVVVRATAADLTITCGGVEMADPKTVRPTDRLPLAPDQHEPTLIGKRYVDENDNLELLCTKPGQGRLAVNGAPLTIKSAKPLPASD